MSEPEFADWNAFSGHIGYPQIVNVDETRILASTWLGRCFVLDLDNRTTSPEPVASRRISNMALGETLTSPTTARQGTTIMAAAAARCCWASYWKLGGSAATTLHPDSGQTVNEVSFASDAQRIALGLGMFPLSDATTPTADVELWSIGDGTRHLKTRRLPGVAVTNLEWIAGDDLLIVVTGARSQDRGHIVLLNAELDILDICEIGALCKSVRTELESDQLVTVLYDRVEVRALSDLGTVTQTIPVDGDFLAAAISVDLEEVFLTNGQLITPVSGDCEQMNPLPDCTCVLQVLGGRWVGLSTNGVVRIWQPSHRMPV